EARRYNRQEDFYISYWKDNQWTVSEPLGPPLNTPENEGAQSISADGRLMYYTACNRSGGFGKCDIYYSEKVGDKWTRPSNLGSSVNSSFSEKQPSISPDGRTLYFISDRPGGKGGYDIWVTTKSAKGNNWSKPRNLGDTINTTGHEQSPFIHADNETFYFTSDGHVGMGGFDIFKSSRLDSGKWKIPENLGYPINTWNDEMGLIVNSSGKRAYYSSTRDEKMGNDLFSFVLPEKLRPTPVSYMKGIVYDAGEGFPLSADFELIELHSGQTIFNSFSDPTTGEFLVCIPADNNYALNVSRPGYMFYSENFAFEGVHEISDPFLVDIPLHPIKEGVTVILKNIFFETDSYQLKSESKVELDKLIQFLQQNESVVIEIAGHTDKVGTEEYNLDLSFNRAGAVVNYLIDNDIEESRLVPKGYGETQPVATNDTREGRALNRRTEFKILDK
ncbi:MAG: OmpA family protein, partial [bacterium]